jgi:integrase
VTPRKLPFGHPETKLNFTDRTIIDFFDSMGTMSRLTRKNARDRMSLLPRFVKEHYNGISVDELVAQVKVGDKLDRYQVLSRFAVWIKRDLGKSDDRTRKMVTQAKLFLEHCGIEFSDNAFRARVKLPRAGGRRQKPAVDRETIIQILQAASNQPNLQLALLWHAATGRRPSEIFSLRHADIDTARRRYRIRPEFSKMRTADERPMTAELAARTESYLRWKHRPREMVQLDHKTSKKHWVIKTPELRPGDLLFGHYRWPGYTGPKVSPATLYDEYSQALRELIDSLGNIDRVVPDDPYAPRKFTLYRLRDHAKTAISDLGYSDYSEWFIAHSGSTYYQQSEKKRAEIFSKVEPSLTYLDTLALEGKHAHMETRLEQQQDDYRRVVDELRLERERTQRLAEDLEQDEGYIWHLQEVLEQNRKEQQEFKRQFAEAIRESQQAAAELRETVEEKLREREKKNKHKG